jgi:hypothetical protein
MLDMAPVWDYYGAMTGDQNEIKEVNLRIPMKIYKKVLRKKKQNPHISINALLVEAIKNDIESEGVETHV